MTYLFYEPHKSSDMQRNVCWHMGLLFFPYVQFINTSPFLSFFKKKVKVQMCAEF